MAPAGETAMMAGQSVIPSRPPAYHHMIISHITLRRMGAAFGWLWAPKYEPRIWEQVLALTTPIDSILAREGFQNREPMIKALWSLYYTGFRHAVMHRASGEACLAEIRPALQLILRR